VEIVPADGAQPALMGEIYTLKPPKRRPKQRPQPPQARPASAAGPAAADAAAAEMTASATTVAVTAAAAAAESASDADAADAAAAAAADAAAPSPMVILYAHGGAFCCCTSATHRSLLASLCLATGATVYVRGGSLGVFG